MSDEYTGPRDRAADKKLSWRLSYVWGQFRWLIGIAGLLSTAGLIRFWSPAVASEEVHAQIHAAVQPIIERQDRMQTQLDTMKLREDASLNDRVDQRRMLEFIARATCVSLSLHQREVLGGLEVCDAASRPMQHAINAKIRAPGEPY